MKAGTAMSFMLKKYKKVLTGQQANGIMQYIKQRRYKRLSYGAFYMKKDAKQRSLVEEPLYSHFFM